MYVEKKQVTSTVTSHVNQTHAGKKIRVCRQLIFARRFVCNDHVLLLSFVKIKRIRAILSRTITA